MPDFEFVNVDRPDDVKKHSTQIRQHVMKDIGKARRRPKKCRRTTIATTTGEQDGSRSRTRRSPVDSASRSESSSSPEGLQGSPGAVWFPSPVCDNSLSAIVYPTEMDETRLNLVRFMFRDARENHRFFRVHWLTTSLSDAAAWHITLANAVLLPVSPDQPTFTIITEARKWYALSLESIARRLADPKESRSEALIVAIAGFMCHESCSGNFARLEEHLKGLKRLLETLGGLDRISSPFLRFAISWQDLAGAAYQNTLPRFDLPQGSITKIDTGNDTAYLERLLQSWDRSCPTLGDIMDAIRATAAVASYVKRHWCTNPKFWTDDMTAARLLIPALHEVLSLEGRALPNDPSDHKYGATAAREAFRRAALVFLASIKVKLGSGAMEMERHIDAFRQISQLPHVDWALVPELNLWAHVVGAMEEESPKRAWHVLTIVNIMDSLGLTSSGQAVDLVRDIIWIEALAEGKIESLCREIDAVFRANAVE